MTENEDWYASDVATFGDRVAAARENADMTQAALAKRLGIKQSTLRGWKTTCPNPAPTAWQRSRAFWACR